MDKQHHFLGFRLDLTNEQFWQGEREIRWRRKTFQVLRYLLSRAGQLATKVELLDAVWAGIAASDSAPSICVAELRKALGDDARTPSLIETVHGRGYRFKAPCSLTSSSSDTLVALDAQLTVGRDEELAQMRHWFVQANRGSRQVVFVTGEPASARQPWSFLEELARDNHGPMRTANASSNTARASPLCRRSRP